MTLKEALNIATNKWFDEGCSAISERSGDMDKDRKELFLQVNAIREAGKLEPIKWPDHFPCPECGEYCFHEEGCSFVPTP